MKCVNCGHQLSEAVQAWKVRGKKYFKGWSGYWRVHQPYAVGSLGFEGRTLFNYLKTCHCSCKRPEPKEGGLIDGSVMMGVVTVSGRVG